MSGPVRAIHSHWPRTVVLLAACLGLALFITSAATALGSVDPKRLVLMLLGIGVLIFAIYSRRPKQVFLFAWVFALTYNRQFFSFEALVGNQGSAGPYWLLADLFFLLLLAIWAVEYLLLKRRRTPRGMNLLKWYLPYATICLLSVFAADRMDWAAYEFIRTIKVGLVLLYVRYNFEREDWWLALVAIGLAASAQAALGTLEVATGRSGVLWLVGLQEQLDTPALFSELEYYGWVRATATMAHPPMLAMYLLIAIPVAFALFVAARPRRLRLGAAVICAVCIVGMACTLSRLPAVLTIAELFFLLPALFMLRLAPVKRCIGLFLIGGFTAMVALAPLTDFIADRVQRDFDRSVDLRFKEYAVAQRMWLDNPMLGVGPNNYSEHLVAYGSEGSWGIPLKNQDIATKQLKVRYISGPLNAYLLALAETGALGLLCLLVYFCGTLLAGLRAVAGTSGNVQVASLGLVAALVACLLQQSLDYSYWIDPLLYTVTLSVSLLAVAPALFGRDKEAVNET